MSEDINIRIKSDESGAVAGFKRLRNEILNNEKGLQEIGKQGRISGTALKDMADVLGPEFQILGDRIDHLTGSLEDVRGASLVTKASLIGLVAVASYQVGDMISNWAMQTEAWKAAHDEAIKSIAQSSTFVKKLTEDRFQKQIQLAQLASTEEQKNAELSSIRMQKMNELQDARNQLASEQMELSKTTANDILGYGKEDNAIAEEAIRITKERIKLLQQQFNEADRLRYRPEETGLDAQLAQRRQEAEAAAEAVKQQAEAERKRVAELERSKQAEDALLQSQQSYLDSLEMEIVKLTQGEEAYQRLRLAKQGFTEDTIESALALQREIKALNIKADAERQSTPQREQSLPQLQASQQRFLTRGTGSSVQQKIVDEVKRQNAIASRLLQEAQKQTRMLNNIPKEVTA